MESYELEPASASWLLRRNILGICIGGFLVLVLSVKKFGSSKRLRVPPGPPGWPLLGHLPILGRMPHRSLMKLSEKYGPLMSVRMGLIPAVIVSSPEMAKIFFRTQDNLFASRPPTLNGEVFMYNFQDLATSPYNDHWRRLKKLLESELFSHKRLRSRHLKDFRHEEVLAAIQRLMGAGRQGNLVEIDTNIIQLSFDHMCRICFNDRYFGRKEIIPGSKDETPDLHSLLDEWATIIGSFIPGQFIPFLRKLDLGGYEARLLKLRIEIEKFLNPVIEEHRRKQEDDPKDFLDVLLSLQREKAGDGFPDEQIKAILQDMLLGGVETTANTTIWGLAELMRHPEVTQKLVDELDRVVGKDRLVEESDLVELKYLKATVKETFRMYPVALLGVPHQSIEDAQVAGYVIHKDTIVMLHIYSLGRDPKLWTDPNVFNPERFVDNPVDVKGQHFELLPFGAGRRRCPGMDMGLFLLEMTLAQILHTCVLTLPPGMEVDVEENEGFSLRKLHPLHVLVSPRLRPELYSQYGLRL